MVEIVLKGKLHCSYTFFSTTTVRIVRKTQLNNINIFLISSPNIKKCSETTAVSQRDA